MFPFLCHTIRKKAPLCFPITAIECMFCKSRIASLTVCVDNIAWFTLAGNKQSIYHCHSQYICMLLVQTQPPVLYGDYSDSLVQIVVPDQLAFTDTEVQ